MAYVEGDLPIQVGNGSNGNGNSGFGFGNDAWVLIILFALIFGFGNNNGWGGNGGGSEGAMTNYVLASDFATLERQLDSGIASLERKGDTINAGLCDGFYAMNTGMLNGFAGVNNAITVNGYETRNAINGLSSDLASCCCQQLRAIDSVNFNNAQNACAITNTINSTTRDIMENANSNFRQLHDEIVANRLEDKNAQILAQQNEINALRLRASQEAQNTYLVDKLGYKCPIASYTVPNPFCCYNNGCATGTCGSVL